MAVVLAATGVFVYLQFSHGVDAAIEEGLRSRAQTLLAGIGSSPGRHPIGPIGPIGGEPLVDPDEALSQVLALLFTVALEDRGWVVESLRNTFKSDPWTAGSSQPSLPGSSSGSSSGSHIYVLDSFEQFWSEYPRKTSKKEALSAWQKLKLDKLLLDRILQAVREQKTWPQWKEHGVVPHARTWLHQERWADQRPPDRGSSTVLPHGINEL